MLVVTYMRYLQARHQVGALQREIDRLNNAAPHPTAASAGRGLPRHQQQPLLLTAQDRFVDCSSINGTCPLSEAEWKPCPEPLRLPPTAAGGARGAAATDGGRDRRRRGGGRAAPTGQARWWNKGVLAAARDTLRLLAATAASLLLLVMLCLEAVVSLFVNVLLGAGRAICAGVGWLVSLPELLLQG